jgi:hypothetical protein
MSLLLGFTNWKQICPVSEIQIGNRMPFYKSKSGLWQSWITVPKHDSVFQDQNRTVPRLKYKFFHRHVKHCYSPNSTHVCYRILVHVGFTGFENRHVTGVIPFCFPENSLGIAMFYMSMEKFVFQSWHRSVLVLKNRIMFWNCSSTLSQAGFRLVKRNYVLDLWFNFVTGRI